MHHFKLRSADGAENLARQMHAAANPGGGEIETSRISAQQRNQFCRSRHGCARIGCQHMRRKPRHGDTDEIIDGVVRHASNQRRHRCMRTIDQHRVSIRRGPRDIFSANHAACAGAVFHHHGLAQNVSGRFGDDAAHNVIRPTRREWHHQAHWARRAPCLRMRQIRGKPRRQGQAQRCSALHHCCFSPYCCQDVGDALGL